MLIIPSIVLFFILLIIGLFVRFIGKRDAIINARTKILDRRDEILAKGTARTWGENEEFHSYEKPFAELGEDFENVKFFIWF